ncbi:hypothetical protein OY671_011824, partial [Metschnikowia pulcherrima]
RRRNGIRRRSGRRRGRKPRGRRARSQTQNLPGDFAGYGATPRSRDRRRRRHPHLPRRSSRRPGLSGSRVPERRKFPDEARGFDENRHAFRGRSSSRRAPAGPRRSHLREHGKGKNGRHPRDPHDGLRRSTKRRARDARRCVRLPRETVRSRALELGAR